VGWGGVRCGWPTPLVVVVVVVVVGGRGGGEDKLAEQVLTQLIIQFTLRTCILVASGYYFIVTIRQCDDGNELQVIVRLQPVGWSVGYRLARRAPSYIYSLGG